MKTLVNSLNESIVTESAMSRYLSSNPRDVRYPITAGYTEGGDFGVIIGEVFSYNDKKAIEKNGKLVYSLVSMGNDYRFHITDLEYEMGEEIKDTKFVYFMRNGEKLADCYVFGKGGVYALVN